MTTMSKPQSRKQAKGYLIRENYYMQDSEKGYVYSSSKELLKILNLTQGQEVNNVIHSNLIDNRNPFDKDIKVVKNRKDNEKDRAGFDVSTNAPKSFSLLAEYYKNTNPEKYNQLIEIQKLANQKMMEKLKDYATARVRKDGERKHIKADIVYSSFLHDVTRPNLDNSVDCHVHSHNFIYNIVSYQDENGKTKVVSLNNEEIMKQKMFLGQTYRNELATLLKEAGYGLELTNAKEGFFEIKGFSKEQLDTFSGRSIQIEKEMEKIREKYPLANESKLKDLANAKTKLAKKEIDREKLFEENFERMAKVGINEELIKKIESNTPVHFDRDEIREHIKKAYKSITSLQSTFSMEELVRESLKQNVHLGVNEDYLTDLIIEEQEIIKLADNVFSTQEVIDAELYSIRNLQNKSFMIDKNIKEIDKEIKKQKYELTEGQKGALELITKTDKQFVAIQGDAGSGKTFSMKILHDTYKNKYDFIGLAPTGQAADKLQNDSGIKCITIAKYLLKPIEKTDNKRLIVVDESGMIDSLSMQKLLQLANENGDKIVLIGDTKQLQSVGAGKIFADMQKYGILKVDVTENRRQKTEELRETVQLIKEKNIDKAISKLDIRDFSDYENQELGQNESIEALVNDYKKGDLVIAGTNKERELLNRKIREKLKLGQHNKNEVTLKILKNINLNGVDKYHSSTFQPGDIIQKGKSKYIVQSIKDDKTIVVKSARKDKEIIKELDIYAIENEFQLFRKDKIKLAVGEEIIFTKNFEDNKKGIDFKNGTTGQIKKIDENGNLEIKTEAGRILKFNIKDAPFLDYAYCLTDYKSQGMSKRVVRVLTSANNNLNSFYVQITRAMFQATIYTSNKLDFIAKIKKEQEKTTTLDYLGYDAVTGEVYQKEQEVKEQVLDSWVTKTGGYESLEEHEKEAANTTYELWKENRLSQNKYVYSLNDYVNYVQQNQNKITKKEKENGRTREEIKHDNETTSTNAPESNQNAKTNGKLDSNISASLKSIGRGIRRARIFIERNFSRNFKTTSKNREQIISNLNILKEELGVENVRDFKEYKTKLNSLNLVNYIAAQGKEVTGHNAYFDPKKEEFRITVGSRNLNVVDYLVKAHNYNFKEASELLESAYIQQLTQKLEERKEAEKVVEIEVKETPTPVIKPNLMDIINNAKKEDLEYFATAQGYEHNKEKSSKNWNVMKNPETGDKIIISEKEGIYWYFNPDVPNDKGTLYDFYKNRGISKLSEMIQLIKGTDKTITLGAVSSTSNKSKIIISPDILLDKYNKFKSVFETNNQYLQKRGIDAYLLESFSTIKVDEKNNVITPMYHQVKNSERFDFSGYNKKLANPITINKDGSERNKPLKDLNEGNKGITILMSDKFEIKDKTTQKNIIVAESFIDALSYMQIKELNPKATILISTNGQQSQDMINSIKSVTKTYPNNKTILAYDNDKKGEKFADDTKEVIPNAIIDKPKQKDWNEELLSISSLEMREFIKNETNKNKGNTLEQM